MCIFFNKSKHSIRPRAALFMCLGKYSALGNSAIGNYVVLCSKFILKTVLLEVSYGKNDKRQCYGRTFGTNQKQCYLVISAARGSAARGLGVNQKFLAELF